MSQPKLRIRNRGGCVEIDLHVQPRTSKTEITGSHDGAVKLRVAALPVDGAANRAVLDFFSSLLKISKSRLEIVGGEKSRRKVLRIQGPNLENFVLDALIRNTQV